MSEFIIHPGYLILFCSVLALLSPRKIRRIIVVAAPAVAGLLTAAYSGGVSYTVLFLGKYELVPLCIRQENLMFLCAISVISAVTGIYSLHIDNRFESFSALMYAGGTYCVAAAGDFLTLLFFWEFIMVAALFLILSDRRNFRAVSAGYRYLVMHVIGGNLLLFGVLMLVSGGDASLRVITGEYGAAYYLILAGMGINAAFVPLHTWIPDAYSECSATAVSYMSSFTTKVAVLSMTRIFAGEKLLVLIGIIMIFYGAIYAMMENDIMKLLSYHIVSQLGFMIADIGIGSEIALDGALCVACGNIVFKTVLYMCAGAVIYATGKRRISDLGGLGRNMKLVCVCFFVAALSISGIPPLCGYIGKTYSLMAAEEAGYQIVPWLFVLGGIGTLLSVVYKCGYFAFFGEKKEFELRKLPKNMYVAMVIGAGLCFLFGIQRVGTGILPYFVEEPVYQAKFVLEYVQLVPAAFAAFWIFRKTMKPHPGYTVDVDWIWRKPIRRLLFDIVSPAVCKTMETVGACGRRTYRLIQQVAANPPKYILVKPKNESEGDSENYYYNEDKYRIEIGEGMIGILGGMLAIALFILLRRFF